MQIRELSFNADENEIYEYQSQLLCETVKRAYEETKIYKRKFDREDLKPNDIRDIDDIELIPPITKEEIQKNPLGIVRKSFLDREEKLIKLQTSGTTGNPLVIYSRREDFEKTALYAVRPAKVRGLEEGDKVLLIFPYLGNGRWSPAGMLMEHNYRKYGYEPILVDLKDMDKQVKMLPEVDSLITYVTQLSRLSSLKEKEIEKIKNKINLKNIIISGDKADPFVIDFIEEKLGTRPDNPYAMIEARTFINTPTQYCDKYHTNEDMFKLKIDEKTDEILLTVLDPEATSIILNYRTGDVGEIIKHECKCNFTSIDVKGRVKSQEFSKHLPPERIYSVLISSTLFKTGEVKDAFKIEREKTLDKDVYKITIEKGRNFTKRRNIEEELINRIIYGDEDINLSESAPLKSMYESGLIEFEIRFVDEIKDKSPTKIKPY